jgi:hypothetical protein
MPPVEILVQSEKLRGPIKAFAHRLERVLFIAPFEAPHFISHWISHFY